MGWSPGLEAHLGARRLWGRGLLTLSLLLDRVLGVLAQGDETVAGELAGLQVLGDLHCLGGGEDLVRFEERQALGVVIGDVAHPWRISTITAWRGSEAGMTGTGVLRAVSGPADLGGADTVCGAEAAVSGIPGVWPFGVPGVGAGKEGARVTDERRSPVSRRLDLAAPLAAPRARNAKMRMRRASRTTTTMAGSM